MSNKQKIGHAAEALALAYLQQQGLICIRQNFHSRYGEIDLVMLDCQHCLCFVEVRARKNNGYVTALESVDRRKQRKTILAAQWFLQRYPDYANFECRFDVIAIQYDSEQALLQINQDLLQQQTVNLQWIEHAYTI